MTIQKARPSRRVWLPALFLGLFGAVLAARLVQLQVLQHEAYAAQARSELLGSSTIYARRGAILDRNGGVLATSVDTWDVYLNTRAWRTPETRAAVLEKVSAITRIPRPAIEARLAASGAVETRIAIDLDFELGRQLIEADLPGVVLLPNTARVHPEGDLAAAVLGFTGLDNTGLAGIEAFYNDILQGKAGKAVYERDTLGDPIPYGQYVATEPVPGDDLVLTIDRYLQRLAEEMLAAAVKEHRASGGSIIVMDPANGEILANATLPSVRFSTLEQDLESASEEKSPFKNIAVTDTYEPGSVMKVVTAAAAIDAGVVTPDTTYVDNGVVDVEGVLLKNWDDGVYGTQTMTGVLQHSINSGAVFMQQKLGTRLFQSYLDAFGFGKPTGIDLPGEASGFFRRPEDPGYSPVDVATQSFGQSISVTPVQMMQAIAACINGGNLITPHVVKARIRPDGSRIEVQPAVVRRVISQAASDAVRRMMGEVVTQDPDGWGRNPARYTAGGKSGTANIPVWGTYTDDQQIVSFMGFAPLENPRILVLVRLDQNRNLLTGTQAAGPIFARYVDEALRYLGVPPEKGGGRAAP
ncbi:penicillin-binding protein 2 [Tepidiforma flava]|uniref:Penicillin-binding protein 2 n=1 Tax=Tepidiforma flava TaxID=3004094 RepID=A0ABY7M4I2_9CHLR|nr:penicillin-binding protein 2 [Tepidiforma flava]WBL35431.1 penicillin-binding protein 2 [Tepidiforma flava]